MLFQSGLRRLGSKEISTPASFAAAIACFVAFSQILSVIERLPKVGMTNDDYLYFKNVFSNAGALDLLARTVWRAVKEQW